MSDELNESFNEFKDLDVGEYLDPMIEAQLSVLDDLMPPTSSEASGGVVAMPTAPVPGPGPIANSSATVASPQLTIENPRSNDAEIQFLIDSAVPLKSFIASATVRRGGQKWAPICFGSPYLFEPAERDCMECKFLQRCGREAQHQAKSLPDGGQKLRGINPDCPTPRTSSELNRAAVRHFFRERYLTETERGWNRAAARNRARQELKRRYPNFSAVEAEFNARLSSLTKAVMNPRGDKRIEQLKDRVSLITRVWKAKRRAELEHGRSVSDAEVADAFLGMSREGTRFSRHQARSYRHLIDELERNSRPWAKFKRRPECPTA